MKRIFVETNDSCWDPVYAFTKGLTEINLGVQVEKAVLLRIESDQVADAVERLLAASGIAFTPDKSEEPGLETAEAAIEETGLPGQYGVDILSWKNPFEFHPAELSRLADAEAAIAVNVELEPGESTFAIAKHTEGYETGLSEPVVIEHPQVIEHTPRRAGKATKIAELIPAPLPEKPLCKACQKPFTPDRKGQKYCTRPECVKERQRKWAREAARRKREELKRQNAPGEEAAPIQVVDLVQATDPGIEVEAVADAFQPTEAQLRDAEALEAEIEREYAEIAGQSEASEDIPSLVPFSELPVPAHAARPAGHQDERVWTIVDGPRAGEALTNYQLEQALKVGEMQPGCQVRHRRLGMRRVVSSGGTAQKLVAIRQ